MALGCTVLYSRAKYLPAGDSAVLAEFGAGIDEHINLRVRMFDYALRSAAFPEILEAVPAYRSLLALYDPLQTSYAALIEKLKGLEAGLSEMQIPTGRLERIPVAYGGDYGPDIATVADYTGIGIEDIIRIHTSHRYLVYMIGFTPGFPYLGGMPARLATPRLKQPRLRVPAGSVGIAGSQTGIYPLESPGGWQIIGRTPLRLFMPEKLEPVLLHPGDQVEFNAISPGRYEELLDDERLPSGKDSQASARENTFPPVLRVIKPGILASIQDLGRRGFLRMGVPPSGAADIYSLIAGNLLVGNREDDAGLEITLWGAQFQFLSPTVIAVTGGYLEPRLNSSPLPMWRTVHVETGDRLRFGSADKGCRAYLAVAGGIAAPRSLGSRATFLRAGLGGFKGRSLVPGDELAAFPDFPAPPSVQESLPADLVSTYGARTSLRVILGPQDAAFHPDGIRTFLRSEYRITPASDRMGCRLSGPRIAHRLGADIITDPIPPGAVQVPGNGQPILLMADRQTTGGYAKIAVVIAADLDRAGQLKPGDTVRFEAVNLEEAHRAYRESASKMDRLRHLFP